MALYLIGDLQGCDAPLVRLLELVAFSPSRDSLCFLGDLVNRGPDSLGVLRRIQAYGGAARCVLGNHDLHLLALAHGVRRPRHDDTLAAVLDAPDRAALLAWLAAQPLAICDTIQGRELLMVHAGVLPSWTPQRTVALAREVQDVLRSAALAEFLPTMYGNAPARWDDALQGTERLRCIVNALTRLRFCRADGTMDFETKEGAAAAPAGYLPWYAVPGRRSAAATVAFGHWSTLGWLGREDLWSLDTGCVWGGALSAVRLDPAAALTGRGMLDFELLQVPCEQAQRPGA